jgi:molecular chaperone IbpA
MPFTVGFDELFDKLYGLENNSIGFPPYNITKNDEYNYTIEMALAGYSKKDIEIELVEGEISVSSSRNEQITDVSPSIIHKGISNKNFSRKFTLSDEVHVKSAEMFDGMLFVKLERIIPENRKPKKINIK